jgi:tripartite-type tricarboxylate transporter receptor subunit TctC
MPHRRAMLAAMLATPALARAQGAWPERPVRIIVPFPPGQSTDIVTRLVADELSRRWPQRVVVENRAGARAPADGYTLIAGSTGPLAVNPAVMPRLPYDPERDFAAITNLAQVPLALVAHPSLPANTPEELVALARTTQLDVATAGPASAAHMMAELFAHRAGVRLNMVHYRGSGPAVADLLAGTVRIMADSVASALPNIRAGRLKAVAVASPARVPWLPETRTVAEGVAPGFAAFGWNGLVAPAATPREIIARINADVVAVLREPAVVARLDELAMIADPLAPEAFAAFLRAELAQWREVARIANVRLEG